MSLDLLHAVAGLVACRAAAGRLARWWSKVVEQGGGARWWGKVVEQGGGETGDDSEATPAALSLTL